MTYLIQSIWHIRFLCTAATIQSPNRRRMPSLVVRVTQWFKSGILAIVAFVHNSIFTKQSTHANLCHFRRNEKYQIYARINWKKFQYLLSFQSMRECEGEQKMVHTNDMNLKSITMKRHASKICQIRNLLHFRMLSFLSLSLSRFCGGSMYAQLFLDQFVPALLLLFVVGEYAS